MENIDLNIDNYNLSDILSLFNISYAWIRSSALNIIISPILIDNRVRNMSHPPFAKEGNIVKWMKNLILNKDG